MQQQLSLHSHNYAEGKFLKQAARRDKSLFFGCFQFL